MKEWLQFIYQYKMFFKIDQYVLALVLGLFNFEAMLLLSSLLTITQDNKFIVFRSQR